MPAERWDLPERVCIGVDAEGKRHFPTPEESFGSKAAGYYVREDIYLRQREHLRTVSNAAAGVAGTVVVVATADLAELIEAADGELGRSPQDLHDSMNQERLREAVERCDAALTPGRKDRTDA